MIRMLESEQRFRLRVRGSVVKNDVHLREDCFDARHSAQVIDFHQPAKLIDVQVIKVCWHSCSVGGKIKSGLRDNVLFVATYIQNNTFRS